MAAAQNENVMLCGFCACERNQYSISIGPVEFHRVQIFFDNSAASRRAQATPVTVWLRVPLAWYSSFTAAQFEDESHALIKRAFTQPSALRNNDCDSSTTYVKRQFCGFCGTHLTKLELTECDDETTAAAILGQDTETIDVTLGSLSSSSLDTLETLGVFSDQGSDSDESQDEADDTKRKPMSDEPAQVIRESALNPEDHLSQIHRKVKEINRTSPVSVKDHFPPTVPLSHSLPGRRSKSCVLHQMSFRGIPYFESMIENSRLARIKHRRGKHVSGREGSSMVWDVTEIDNELQQKHSLEKSESESPEFKRARLI